MVDADGCRADGLLEVASGGTFDVNADSGVGFSATEIAVEDGAKLRLPAGVALHTTKFTVGEEVITTPGKYAADAYPDLKSAIEEVTSGLSEKNEIWILAGEHSVELEPTFTRPFTFRGGFTGRETTPAERLADERTVLTDSGVKSTLRVENGAGATLTFDRIDFVRGATRGLQKTGAGDLVVFDCRFADNGRGTTGAGLALHATGSAGALLVVSNCVFEGQRPANSCSEGATVRVASFARATFDDCLFMTNGIAFGNPSGDHVFCQARGAAFLAKGVPVTMRNCRFAGNSAGNCSPSSASDGSDHGGVCVLAGACGGSAFTNCAWVANAERTYQSFDGSQSGGGSAAG